MVADEAVATPGLATLALDVGQEEGEEHAAQAELPADVKTRRGAGDDRGSPAGGAGIQPDYCRIDAGGAGHGGTAGARQNVTDTTDGDNNQTLDTWDGNELTEEKVEDASGKTISDVKYQYNEDQNVTDTTDGDNNQPSTPTWATS